MPKIRAKRQFCVVIDAKANIPFNANASLGVLFVEVRMVSVIVCVRKRVPAA